MNKVMVGMSGGVDSSVAAALLVEKGYEVCGLTLNLLGENSSTSTDTAQKVAKKLGIKHKVLNLKDVFRTNVIDYFVREYQCGRTPNPCIVCNKKIKFGAMLDFALQNGYDFIATGHYSNIFYNNNLKRWLLKKSNSLKDQSYFLYNLTQHQLAHSLFPLANYEKSYIRELASKYDLPNIPKSESQDICFINNITPAEFILQYTHQKISPGIIEDIYGKKIGEHKGITNYTVGQRKGLGVALGEPAYVCKLDAPNNKVILGNRNSGSHTEITVQNPNFILFDRLQKEMKALAKIRYRASQIPCKLIPDNTNSIKVIFDNPVYFPAPGQSIVFYNNDGMVIGGGLISNIYDE